YDSNKRISPALAELKEIGNYRHLLAQLVRRDILTRYKRSFLGVAWTMLNPLGTMLVMTIVFSNIFKASMPGVPFPVYILSGLVVWNFFSQGTNASMSGLVWGGNLLQRIFVPRTIFAVSAVGTALVNTIIALVPLIIVMLVTKATFSWALLFLPVAIILIAFFTLGFGLLISSLAAFFPDVMEMYQILLTAWMYLTPIIYPESIIPERLQTVYRLNPMYWLVRVFRAPIVEQSLPALRDFSIAAAISFIMLIVGWLVFTSKSDEYAYRI
ncbi:MAG: ABC transporter permease, partial [Chloroflexi bacterium]|nr:ABC transporter permease [Chloroflexota bacterium]